jgi:hypothetical protein
MKILSLVSVLGVLIFASSCKKENNSQADASHDVARTVLFTLYTDKDFSNDNENIVFNVFIQTGSNQPIWDSTFSAMKVKDIPSLVNKIVVEKTITGYGDKLLKVGFRYTLPGVGDSWFYDADSPGQTMKEVTFNFQ